MIVSFKKNKLNLAKIAQGTVTRIGCKSNYSKNDFTKNNKGKQVNTKRVIILIPIILFFDSNISIAYVHTRLLQITAHDVIEKHNKIFKYYNYFILW